MNFRSIFPVLGAAASALAVSPGAPAAEVARAIDFLPVTQLVTQAARLWVTNLPDQRGGVPPDPCSGEVGFYDPSGALYGGKTFSFSLHAGQSMAFIAPVALGNGSAAGVRARATFAARPKEGGLDACGGVHASYEVFDSATLETRLLNPGVIRGFNPQPDPPGAR